MLSLLYFHGNLKTSRRWSSVALWTSKTSQEGTTLKVIARRHHRHRYSSTSFVGKPWQGKSTSTSGFGGLLQPFVQLCDESIRWRRIWLRRPHWKRYRETESILHHDEHVTSSPYSDVTSLHHVDDWRMCTGRWLELFYSNVAMKYTTKTKYH